MSNKQIARAIRCMMATYNLSMREAIAEWRGLSDAARRSWAS